MSRDAQPPVGGIYRPRKQTFDDLATFNPHFHALVAEAVFLPSGMSRVLPATFTRGGPVPHAAAQGTRFPVL